MDTFHPGSAFEVAVRTASTLINIPPEEWEGVEIRKGHLSWRVMLEYRGVLLTVSMGKNGENPWVLDPS